MPRKGLTRKQARFVEEYLIDLNATQAAIRAGYSAKTAYSIGDENLRKPVIAAEIQRRTQKRSNKAELTREWVIEKLRENAERAMEAEVHKAGQVANKALELLGKHQGMFSDNLNLRTPDGPVEIAITRRIVQDDED